MEPLAGAATMEDERTLAFEGWMELIRVVAALLGSNDTPPVDDPDSAAPEKGKPR